MNIIVIARHVACQGYDWSRDCHQNAVYLLGNLRHYRVR